MTKQEMIDFIRENLWISIDVVDRRNGSGKVEVRLILDDEAISEDRVWVPGGEQ